MAKLGMDIIMNVLEIAIGLVILPVLAVFVATAIANTSVAAIPGMTILLPLIPLAVGFGLVIKGVSGIRGK